MKDIIARGMANEAQEQVIIVQREVEALPNGLVYRGAVDYYNELPTDAKAGDTYTVKYQGTSGTVEDGTEYAWGEYDEEETWIALTPKLADVARTGSYTDLTNKPTIPSYTAGTGITITNGVIGYDEAEISSVDYVDANITDTMNFIIQERDEEAAARIAGDNLKQDKLIAGTGITIAADGKTISASSTGSDVAIPSAVYGMKLTADSSGIPSKNVDESSAVASLKKGWIIDTSFFDSSVSVSANDFGWPSALFTVYAWDSSSKTWTSSSVASYTISRSSAEVYAIGMGCLFRFNKNQWNYIKTQQYFMSGHGLNSNNIQDAIYELADRPSGIEYEAGENITIEDNVISAHFSGINAQVVEDVLVFPEDTESYVVDDVLVIQ